MKFRDALLRNLASLARDGQPATYQPGQACPCCGWMAWHVGRSTAECARCGEALPLAENRRA
jgi:ribosomal protein S27AE